MCWFKAWNSPWMLSLHPGGCEVELFNCLAVTLQCFMETERSSCHRVCRQILAELKLFRLCFILPPFHTLFGAAADLVVHFSGIL